MLGHPIIRVWGMFNIGSKGFSRLSCPVPQISRALGLRVQGIGFLEARL